MMFDIEIEETCNRSKLMNFDSKLLILSLVYIKSLKMWIFTWTDEGKSAVEPWFWSSIMQRQSVVFINNINVGPWCYKEKRKIVYSNAWIDHQMSHCIQIFGFFFYVSSSTENLCRCYHYRENKNKYSLFSKKLAKPRNPKEH